MDKNLTSNNRTLLSLLRERVERNYSDFKSEMLMLGEEGLFDKAHRIAAVRDACEQITSEDADYLDEDDVAFLMKFYNPLEMVADYLQERQANYPVEIDEALMELFNAENHEENYLTMDLANELIEKYGEDEHIKIALLRETAEVGERYVRLLKLANTADKDGFCDWCDEDGYFIYEDDGEGYF